MIPLLCRLPTRIILLRSHASRRCKGTFVRHDDHLLDLKGHVERDVVEALVVPDVDVVRVPARSQSRGP